MKELILLIQFFTRIPIKSKIDYNEGKYGKSTYLLPLIGLLIGGIIFFVYKGSLYAKIPLHFIAFIRLISNIILTGALHLDGLADTCDGIFSYRTRERILEIMKDSHIGVNGVIALIIAILGKGLLYFSVGVIPIVLSIMIGRLAIIMSASFGEYARDKGMAIAIIKYNNYKSFLKSLLITFLVFLFFKSYFINLILTLIFACIIHKNIVRKIGGITGDTLGFICEISEIFFLFTVLVIS